MSREEPEIVPEEHELIWTRMYRRALHILPSELRRKHGSAMEALFARELARAHERGRLAGMLAGAVGTWDVVRRAAYEYVRDSRVALSKHNDYRRGHWYTDAPKQGLADAHIGGPRMPKLTTGQLLRRHAAPFAVSLMLLTASLLAFFTANQLSELRERGESAGTIIQALMLAVPSTTAITIPMAVFIAVFWVFTRLGAVGTLAAAQQGRNGVRHLTAPVLGAAAGVAVLSLMLMAQIVPRANVRLSEVLSGTASSYRSDRAMTLGELRTAAQTASAHGGQTGTRHATEYEVEIQKKYALAAACVVLALAGVALGLRFTRTGLGVAIVASFAVFCGYYICLIVGETLADELLVSPIVAMWLANIVVLAAALLAVWGTPGRVKPHGMGSPAIET